MRNGKNEGYILFLVIILGLLITWFLNIYFLLEKGKIERYRDMETAIYKEWELENIMELGKYELKRIDTSINNGKVQDIFEYFLGNPRIWLEEYPKLKDGYTVQNMTLNGNSIAVNGIRLNTTTSNTLRINLIKKINLNNRKIVYEVRTSVYYEKGNMNLEKPDEEKIEEVSVRYDKIGDSKNRDKSI